MIEYLRPARLALLAVMSSGEWRLAWRAWYSFDYKKDGTQRHPQIFNSGLSGLDS
jgi:hypothetical protein